MWLGPTILDSTDRKYFIITESSISVGLEQWSLNFLRRMALSVKHLIPLLYVCLFVYTLYACPAVIS